MPLRLVLQPLGDAVLHVRPQTQLLQNVYDFAVLGDEDRMPPNQQPWYAKMLAADQLDAALHLLVDNYRAHLCAYGATRRLRAPESGSTDD
jgi:hypothetical protein